jgi:maleate isomerase
MTHVPGDGEGAASGAGVPARAGGWRRRLGVVVPSVNTVVEPWFGAASPEGVTVHASRMFLEDALSPDAIVRMDREEGLPAVKRLGSCRPHAVAYCCTASSIVQGLAYDRRLEEEVSHAAGVPATTATQAILRALEALGARRVSMASPYTEAIDRAEHAFFASAGLEVVSSACLGIGDAFRLAEPTPPEIVELARRAFAKGAEALVITCLNLWSQVVVEALERELGVPVVTSTQATFWRLLRIGGVPDRVGGYGRLLARH